jgi:hypothetical protein
MEYFVHSNSWAAPFVSDEGNGFTEGATPSEAMEKFVAAYKHPRGLYAAHLYASSDAFHKREYPLVTWLCNHEQAKQAHTKDMGSYSFMSNGPGDFEIDGKRITVKYPKSGSIVAAERGIPHGKE